MVSVLFPQQQYLLRSMSARHLSVLAAFIILLCRRTSLNAHAHARVSNARCQTGLNFGERSKFAVATFLSLAVCHS